MGDWVEDGRDYDAIEEELAGVLTPFIHLSRLNFDSKMRRRLIYNFPTHEFLAVLHSFPASTRFLNSVSLWTLSRIEKNLPDAELRRRKKQNTEYDNIILFPNRFGWYPDHSNAVLFGFPWGDRLTLDEWRAVSKIMEEVYNENRQNRCCFHAVHYRLREDEGPPTTTVMTSVGPCISDGRAVCTCHHLEWLR